MMVQSISQDEFDAKVINSVQPVVVEVVGKRCTYCKQMAPLVAEAAEKTKDQALFFELMANDNIDLTRKLKVRGVPTVLYYMHGVLIHRASGVQSVRKMVKQVQSMKNYTKEEAQKNAHKSIINRILKR